MSELLLDSDLSAAQREYARVALSSAQALMHVINDVVDFANIEAGRLELQRASFSVQAAVGEVCALVGGKAHEKGLELSVLVDPDVPACVLGDGGRVAQVLENLLTNAIKFTPDGAVTVRVAPDDSAATDERLRFEVADTGIGVAPEELENLFDVLARGELTAGRGYGAGPGLGLSIAGRLVALMGGEIGVHSVPGSGSTFWFTLPCRPAE
jgi:signal transduction histidine kinase